MVVGQYGQAASELLTDAVDDVDPTDFESSKFVVPDIPIL